MNVHLKLKDDWAAELTIEHKGKTIQYNLERSDGRPLQCGDANQEESSEDDDYLTIIRHATYLYLRKLP